MDVPYSVEIRRANTLEDLQKESWKEAACFSSLKNSVNRYYSIRFNKKYDAATSISKGHTTEEWIEQFDIPEHVKRGFTIVHTEDAYIVTVDLTILSFVWAFSLLTLYRYPSEYYNIIYVYWQVKEKWSKLSNWEALYLAHQGHFDDYPWKYYSYNSNHSLYAIGSGYYAIERVFTSLDKNTVFFPNRDYQSIQPKWSYLGWTASTNFSFARDKWGKHITLLGDIE